MKRWLAALVLCVAVVLVGMAWVDRPLALFFDAHLAHGRFADLMNFLITERKLTLAAVVLLALGTGVHALRGGSLARLPRVVLACVVSALVAAALERTLKYIFGRADISPTFLEQHAYGFHWLHGAEGWATFPSGTASVTFAIASTLWLFRGWRELTYAVAVVLSLLVVVLNYHWFSDIVAGSFLGTTIGLVASRMLRNRRPERR